MGRVSSTTVEFYMLPSTLVRDQDCYLTMNVLFWFVFYGYCRIHRIISALELSYITA